MYHYATFKKLIMLWALGMYKELCPISLFEGKNQQYYIIVGLHRSPLIMLIIEP